MSTRSKVQGAECVTVREGEDSGQRGCLRVQGVLARRTAATGDALEEARSSAKTWQHARLRRDRRLTARFVDSVCGLGLSLGHKIEVEMKTLPPR